nr:transcription initiation factor TFIID subunit 4-like [Aegilops tauschii subsp. strangulata]
MAARGGVSSSSASPSSPPLRRRPSVRACCARGLASVGRVHPRAAPRLASPVDRGRPLRPLVANAQAVGLPVCCRSQVRVHIASAARAAPTARTGCLNLLRPWPAALFRLPFPPPSPVAGCCSACAPHPGSSADSPLAGRAASCCSGLTPPATASCLAPLLRLASATPASLCRLHPARTAPRFAAPSARSSVPSRRLVQAGSRASWPAAARPGQHLRPAPTSPPRRLPSSRTPTAPLRLPTAASARRPFWPPAGFSQAGSPTTRPAGFAHNPACLAGCRLSPFGCPWPAEKEKGGACIRLPRAG